MPAAIAAVREKEARALEMVKAGAQLAAIAAALGYANESGAWKAVQRALSRIGQATADELREIERERLADVYRHTLTILSRHHPVLHKGAPVVVDGVTLDDDGIKLRALEVLIRADESYRKLLGLDLPRKVEVSGPDGEAIPLELKIGSLLERLEAIPADVVEQKQLGEGGEHE